MKVTESRNLKHRKPRNEGYLQRVPAEQGGHAGACALTRMTETDITNQSKKTEGSMEKILEPDNLNKAYKLVMRNKGSGGVIDLLCVNRFDKSIGRILGTEWGIAVRFRENDCDFSEFKTNRFSLIPNTWRYWLADPFIIEDQEENYVFFEAFDRLKNKGLIGYSKIINGRIGKINIIIEETFHLSYPFIYKRDGVWFMIPESRRAGQIIRYKATSFPGKWEKDRILAKEISAVDSTIFLDAYDVPLLITYVTEKDNKEALYLAVEKDDKFVFVKKMEDPLGTKRPAGKIFSYKGQHYRPSQLCAESYGEALIINKIISITKKGLIETEYRTIGVDDITLDRTIKITGIHTYNCSKQWEVIDVRFRSIKNILSLLPRVLEWIKQRVCRVPEETSGFDSLECFKGK